MDFGAFRLVSLDCASSLDRLPDPPRFTGWRSLYRNGPTSDVLRRPACTASRFRPKRSTYRARLAARTPRKGRTRERIRTPSSYRYWDACTSQPCFVLSLLDSARSKPHQFAFAPSRDASADAGLLVGLAAFAIPRSLLPEGPRRLDVSDRFLPPNQLRTTAPVLSVLELRSHANEENGVSRRTLSLRPNHLVFEEGFSP